MRTVRSETTGLATGNVCKLPFVLPEEARGATFALLRTRIPRMPFRFEREAQVTVDGEVFALDHSRSLVHLCELLSGLRNGAGAQVVEAYYNGSEFEACAMANQVTLDTDLGDALGIPATLAANQCYTSAIDETEMSESDYYRFAVEGMTVQGFFANGVYTQTISEVHQDDTPSDTFVGTDNSRSFSVHVTVVKKDGTEEELYVGNTDRIAMWLTMA